MWFKVNLKKKRLRVLLQNSFPQWIHNLNYFMKDRQKGSKEIQSPAFVSFGEGKGKVLIDSHMCLYCKWVLFLSLLTFIQISIYREIWSQVSFSWFLFFLENILHGYCEMVSSEMLLFEIPFIGHNIPPNLEMQAGLYISHFLTVLAIFPKREEKPYKISFGPQSRNICWSHE